MISDRELADGCIAQKRAFQKALFDRFAGPMLALCRRYTADKMEAQDMVQESFIKVFERMDQYQNGALGGWIRKIFIHTCLSHFRKKKIEWVEFDEDMNVYAEDEVLEKLENADFLQLLESLPPASRVVFNLYALEGYDHSEIASMLHIAEGTSRAHVAQARKLLQSKIHPTLKNAL